MNVIYFLCYYFFFFCKNYLSMTNFMTSNFIVYYFCHSISIQHSNKKQIVLHTKVTVIQLWCIQSNPAKFLSYFPSYICLYDFHFNLKFKFCFWLFQLCYTFMNYYIPDSIKISYHNLISIGFSLSVCMRSAFVRAYKPDSSNFLSFLFSTVIWFHIQNVMMTFWREKR